MCCYNAFKKVHVIECANFKTESFLKNNVISYDLIDVVDIIHVTHFENK